MARVYAIKDYDEWDFKADESWEEYDARTGLMFDELHVEHDKVINEEKDNLVGYIFQAPYADGNAIYVVAQEKPLTLLHVPWGDAWRLPEPFERGLRLSDIRKDVEWNRRWMKLDKKDG